MRVVKFEEGSFPTGRELAVHARKVNMGSSSGKGCRGLRPDIWAEFSFCPPAAYLLFSQEFCKRRRRVVRLAWRAEAIRAILPS